MDPEGLGLGFFSQICVKPEAVSNEIKVTDQLQSDLLIAAAGPNSHGGSIISITKIIFFCCLLRRKRSLAEQNYTGLTGLLTNLPSNCGARTENRTGELKYRTGMLFNITNF